MERIHFRGSNSVKIIFPPFWKGSTVKGKNLLPLGANSILLDPFQKGLSVQWIKQEDTEVGSLGRNGRKSAKSIQFPEVKENIMTQCSHMHFSHSTADSMDNFLSIDPDQAAWMCRLISVYANYISYLPSVISQTEWANSVEGDQMPENAVVDHTLFATQTQGPDFHFDISGYLR